MRLYQPARAGPTGIPEAAAFRYTSVSVATDRRGTRMDAKQTRRLKLLLQLLIPACLAFVGYRRGCDSGPYPELTQSLRPGVPAVEKPVAATPTSRPTPPPTAGPRDFVIGFWNCENFFDDQDDHRNGQGDKEYDALFAKHPELFKLKLDKLTEGILSLNNGRGPDIMAIVEVESVRAAQMLQATLNGRLDPSLHYRNLLMKEMNSGRHIAPAILTRLPVNASRTRVVGSRQRILEGHVVVDEHDLTIIVGHWTSRLQKDGPAKRMEYGEKMYGDANALYHGNPKADILLCGDFNDNPTDPSVVQGLRSVNDPRMLASPDGHLRLFSLFGAWTPRSGYGTLYYQGWNLFDQFHVSPGMLDAEGWRCDPASVRIGNHLAQPSDPQHRPWRFGGEHEKGVRGYSDHFPVALGLHVAP
jgi:endonuclease/exonuclease/phosphatase family metal-dependent hydrolase